MTQIIAQCSRGIRLFSTLSQTVRFGASQLFYPFSPVHQYLQPAARQFCEAVAAGDINRVWSLQTRFPSMVNQCARVLDYNAPFPLEIALTQKNEAMVEFLFRRGAGTRLYRESIFFVSTLPQVVTNNSVESAISTYTGRLARLLAERVNLEDKVVHLKQYIDFMLKEGDFEELTKILAHSDLPSLLDVPVSDGEYQENEFHVNRIPTYRTFKEYLVEALSVLTDSQHQKLCDALQTKADIRFILINRAETVPSPSPSLSRS